MARLVMGGRVWLVATLAACGAAPVGPAPTTPAPPSPAPGAPSEGTAASTACVLEGRAVSWPGLALATGTERAPFATIFAPAIDAVLRLPVDDAPWLPVRVAYGGVAIDAVVPRGAITVFATAPLRLAAGVTLGVGPLGLEAGAVTPLGVAVAPHLPKGLRVVGAPVRGEVPCDGLALASSDAAAPLPPSSAREAVTFVGAEPVVLRSAPGGAARFSLTNGDADREARVLARRDGWVQVWVAIDGAPGDPVFGAPWLAVTGWVEGTRTALSVASVALGGAGVGVFGPGSQTGALDVWRCPRGATLRLATRVVGEVLPGAEVTTSADTAALAGASVAWLTLHDRAARLELDRAACERVAHAPGQAAPTPLPSRHD